MEVKLKHQATFARLPEIEPREILVHMPDPRISEHMPLLTFEWDAAAVTKFIAAKEECWVRDGLGRWATLSKSKNVGWGSFQKEDDERDFGLVLRPDAFGLGARFARKAIEFAVGDERIPFVTFLLPPLRETRVRSKDLRQDVSMRSNKTGQGFSNTDWRLSDSLIRFMSHPAV